MLVRVDLAAPVALLEIGGVLVALRHFLQVRTGGEGASRPGEDGDPHLGVFREVIQGFLLQDAELSPQGVEAVGPVHRERGVMLGLVLLVNQVWHGVVLLVSTLTIGLPRCNRVLIHTPNPPPLPLHEGQAPGLRSLWTPFFRGLLELAQGGGLVLDGSDVGQHSQYAPLFVDDDDGTAALGVVGHVLLRAGLGDAIGRADGPVGVLEHAEREVLPLDPSGSILTASVVQAEYLDRFGGEVGKVVTVPVAVNRSGLPSW